MRLDAVSGNHAHQLLPQDYNFGDLKYAAFGVSPGNCGTGNSEVRNDRERRRRRFGTRR
jgi:hypothetical protein